MKELKNLNEQTRPFSCESDKGGIEQGITQKLIRGGQRRVKQWTALTSIVTVPTKDSNVPICAVKSKKSLCKGLSISAFSR